MEFDIIFTLVALAILITSLVRDIASPALLFIGVLGIFLFAGLLSPEEAFRGFANESIFTILCLLVIAEAIKSTGALNELGKIILNQKRSLNYRLFILLIITGISSAFVYNTAILLLFIPMISNQSGDHKIPSALVYLPLSYATILGGMITIYGTSSNVIAHQILVDRGFEGMGLTELAWIGIPAFLIVVFFVTFFHQYLLPEHLRNEENFEDGLKDCLFELKVANESELAFKSIEQSGLRAIGGAYLAHIQRGQQVIPASPNETLLPGDTLLFTGSAKALEELLETPGLVRGTDPIEDIYMSDTPQTLPLFEAVVSRASSLVGRTLRDVRFRERYGGIVLGIQRTDEKLRGGVGRIPLKAGDLLLIEARSGFDKRWNDDRDDFYLVALRTERIKHKPLTRRAPIALVLLLMMIIAFATKIIPLVTAAFVTAIGMILTRCIRGQEARASIDFSLFAVIGASFGIDQAVKNSGLGEMLIRFLIQIEILGPISLLVTIYIITNLLAEFINANTAVILVLNTAIEATQVFSINPTAIAVIVAVSATASFITPYGHENNLIVMPLGQYQMANYLKFGIPVSIIVMTVTITITYIRWLA